MEEFDASADETEVLALLGITKDDTEGQAKPVENAAAEGQESQLESTPDNSTLKTKIQDLETQSQEKTEQVSKLKTELSVKDDRIRELENKLSGESGSATVRVGNSFKSQYDQALSLYKSRKYKEALARFDELLNSSKTNDLIDNCQYWKGECYYGIGDYQQAIIEFQKVFAFENSNKFDDAQLKLGLCYLQLKDNAKAKSEFEKLLYNYPDSEYAGKAQYYMSGL
ncbi:tetratricopeptide repeat protein [candidate division KSB1 bacterium]|nr:tetratricopeptide repeat protein [candidate division KSB1 bacterium]